MSQESRAEVLPRDSRCEPSGRCGFPGSGLLPRRPTRRGFDPHSPHALGASRQERPVLPHEAICPMKENCRRGAASSPAPPPQPVLLPNWPASPGQQLQQRGLCPRPLNSATATAPVSPTASDTAPGPQGASEAGRARSGFAPWGCLLPSVYSGPVSQGLQPPPVPCRLTSSKHSLHRRFSWARGDRAALWGAQPAGSPVGSARGSLSQLCV